MISLRPARARRGLNDRQKDDAAFKRTRFRLAPGLRPLLRGVNRAAWRLLPGEAPYLNKDNGLLPAVLINQGGDAGELNLAAPAPTDGLFRHRLLVVTVRQGCA